MTSQTKQCTTVQKNEFEQPCVLFFFYYTKLVIAVQNFFV